MKEGDHFAISGARVVCGTWPVSGPGGPGWFQTSPGLAPPLDYCPCPKDFFVKEEIKLFLEK